MASWKLRMSMLPSLMWITFGGGSLSRMRLERSLSFVMIVRLFSRA